MTPGELHAYKRKNFIEKTQTYFKFLELDFNFSKPNHTFYEQANGTIISDKLEYEHKELNKKLIILNDYHPVDYGFEIRLLELKSGESEMLHYVLKENQDIEQEYLKQSAQFLKRKLLKMIQ